MSYFLGIEVKRNHSLGTISLSQSQDISNILKHFDILHCKPITTPLTTTSKLSLDDAPKTTKESFEIEIELYKQVIGCIRYLVKRTRIDIYISVLVYYHISCSRSRTLAR